MSGYRDALRDLPSVQHLLENDAAARLADRFGRPAVTEALRRMLDEARRDLAEGRVRAAPDAATVVARAETALAARARRGLRRVINATGIVLHTNLGRAPLAPEAVAAVADVAAGYCNLELDLAAGRRGSRTVAVEALVREVAGAEAALPVNNGAAAILLALSALSQGGEVIVSRGELVEIGGGFRIPDVIVQGGARLVEVGSTNRTRLADYRAAIGPETRILLKVHQSNFRTIGFTEETTVHELAGLARAHGLRLVVDLGSGLLRDGQAREPTLREVLAAGADVVTCSGDKLLGGPQAGLIAGRAEALEPMRRHPLLRALRLDKMSLAALEATLMLHRDAPEKVPVNRMLAQAEDVLQARAERLCGLLGAGAVEAVDAYAGGGSLPEERIASRALLLDPAEGAEVAAARLRLGTPAVLARVRSDRLVVDLMAVEDAEVEDLARALTAVLG